MGRGGATGMARAKWTVVARILRVNHGGEYGAIRIYRSQIAIARWRCPELLPFLTETLAHEQTHIAQFRGLMPARASKPCRMMWLWGVGGLILGGVTALLGRQGVLPRTAPAACLAALALCACQPQDPEGNAAPPPADAPAATDAAAPASSGGMDISQPITARGNEPFWAVAITDGTKFRLTRPDQPDVTAEAPGAALSPRGRPGWPRARRASRSP